MYFKLIFLTTTLVVKAADLLVRSTPDQNELGRALELAIKLGAVQTAHSIRLEGLLTDAQLAGLLRAALFSPNCLESLTVLFDQNIPLAVDSELLLGWLAASKNQVWVQ